MTNRDTFDERPVEDTSAEERTHQPVRAAGSRTVVVHPAEA